MTPDTVNEARGPAHDASKAAAASSGDIADDLAALRDDVARLTRRIATVVAARGSATWRKTKSNTEGVVSEAQGKGMDAVDAVRGVGDKMVDAHRRVAEEAALQDFGAWDRISLRRDLAAVTAA